MELTVTKTFMEVVSILSEAFSDAYGRKVMDSKTPCAPYRIANYTGMHISVEVARSGFKVSLFLYNLLWSVFFPLYTVVHFCSVKSSHSHF